MKDNNKEFLGKENLQNIIDSKKAKDDAISGILDIMDQDDNAKKRHVLAKLDQNIRQK